MRTPREIVIMDGKTELTGLLCNYQYMIINFKVNYVSTLEEKVQNSKPGKFCQKNQMKTGLFGEQPIL